MTNFLFMSDSKCLAIRNISAMLDSNQPEFGKIYLILVLKKTSTKKGKAYQLSYKDRPKHVAFKERAEGA